MSWGLSLTLTSEGMARVPDILRALHAALRVVKATSAEARACIWQEVAATGGLRWQWQDRSTPLELAKDAALRMHYFEPAVSCTSL